MSYELWNLTSRNINGFFDSEVDVLRAVREAAELHGRSYAEAFALVQEDRRGRSRTIARGVAFVERAFAREGGDRIPA